MSRLPQLTAKELIKILVKLGFKPMRQSGSHIFFRHDDGRTTVVPNHPGERLDHSLLVKIVKKDIKLTREEFEDLI